MTLELGKTYGTAEKNGDTVTIISLDGSRLWPAVGLLKSKTTYEIVKEYAMNGVSRTGKYGCGLVEIPVKVKRTIFANVYRYEGDRVHIGTPHDREADAAYAAKGRTDFIATTRIDLEYEP